jgi:hypothetical protein
MIRAARRRKIALIMIRFALALVVAETIFSTVSERASAFVHQDLRIRRSEDASNHRRSSPLYQTPTPSISSEEVRSRNLQQLEKLRERDRHSKEIQKQVRRSKLCDDAFQERCHLQSTHRFSPLCLQRT